MVTPYEGYVQVAELLNALTPGDHEKRTALFNSGAEAVENAIKVARLATGRPAVVAFDNAYHGRTNLTMALTAKSMPYKSQFGPFAPEVYRMPASYPLRDEPGLTGEEAARRAISRIETQIGAQSLAAIIIEPIQGEGGFIVPAPGFLSTLTAWAKDNGVVFIADEVQTGFARTGAWFASEHDDIVPDIVTMAKGIAGGMPLSAVTGRAELMDAVYTGGLGGTYGGNPSPARPPSPRWASCVSSTFRAAHASSKPRWCPGCAHSPTRWTSSARCAGAAPCWPSRSSNQERWNPMPPSPKPLPPKRSPRAC